MTRARWWAIGALTTVTLLVVLLDATGVIFTSPDPADEPDPLTLPAALDAETLPPAPVAASTASSQPISPATLRRVQGILADDALGRSLHTIVSPLTGSSDAWIEQQADSPATPASTLKLWTAAATLDAVALDDRLSTSVTWDGEDRTLTLVGGGDATLETDPAKGSNVASLTTLAARTAAGLRRTGQADGRVSLVYDSSLFTGPSVSPDWEPTYVTSGVIAPVTALMVDQGMVNPPSLARYTDPAQGAADVFADLLTERGLRVGSTVSAASTTTPDVDSADVLADVQSPPIGDLVERMLRDSDNQLAEALGRIAALQTGSPASFVGASEAIVAAAEDREVQLDDATVVDASGLARNNALPAAALLDALHFAAEEPNLSPILTGLAVAGFDGTLADRFVVGAAASGAGVVRAKTGTLTGVTAEAGLVTGCNDDLVLYAFVADAAPDTEAAREVFDTAAAELASCP